MRRGARRGVRARRAPGRSVAPRRLGAGDSGTEAPAGDRRSGELLRRSAGGPGAGAPRGCPLAAGGRGTVPGPRDAARLHGAPHGDGCDPGQAPLLGGASARSRLRHAHGGQLHPRGIDEVCTGRHMLSPVRDRADDARGALRYLQGRSRHPAGPDRRFSDGPTARPPTLSVLFDEGAHRAGLPGGGRLLSELHPEVPARAGLPALRAALHPDRRARRLDAGRAMHGDRRAITRGRGAHHDQGVSGAHHSFDAPDDARALPARGEEPQPARRRLRGDRRDGSGGPGGLRSRR